MRKGHVLTELYWVQWTAILFILSFAIYLKQRMSQEIGRHCTFVFCHNTEVESANEHVTNKVKTST
jgi:hypothetical protein